MVDRRCFLASLALGSGFDGFRPAAAQEHWPSRPITLIVPFGAGGGTDILARLLAQHMANALGQPIPIDNRAGASGTLGMAQLARAAGWLHRRNRPQWYLCDGNGTV